MESKEKREPKRIAELYIGNVDGEPVVNRRLAIERERWLESELNRYKSALSGIPNPEAVREVIEAARQLDDAMTDEAYAMADLRISKALEKLDTATSPGAQQK